ncbi:MAG: iron-sulfur cluster assembly protein, partial [Prochlorococcus sp.]
MATAEQASNALDQVKDSGSGRSAVELGWIDNIRVIPPRAVVRLSLPGFAQSQRDQLAQKTREVLLELDGINDVQI